jgi:hypothetical protein
VFFKKSLLSQDDENAPPSDILPLDIGSSSSREKVIPVQKERNRENELEAGKWSQAKLGKKSHAVPIDKIRLMNRASQFFLYCDPLKIFSNFCDPRMLKTTINLR